MIFFTFIIQKIKISPNSFFFDEASFHILIISKLNYISHYLQMNAFPFIINNLTYFQLCLIIFGFHAINIAYTEFLLINWNNEINLTPQTCLPNDSYQSIFVGKKNSRSFGRIQYLISLYQVKENNASRQFLSLAHSSFFLNKQSALLLLTF